MRRVLAAVVVAAMGCASEPIGGGGGRGGDGGSGTGALATNELRGRVVDAESCASTAGCTAVEDVIVAWAGDETRVRTARTGREGAFVLDGVPRGVRTDLLALPQDTAAARYVATLNPMAAHGEADQFGLEIYVVPRDAESLVVGFEREVGVDLVARGGYVGQVVDVDAMGRATAVEGAQVAHAPVQAGIWFVSVLPRFVTGEPVIRPDGSNSTSGFGMFVIAASGGPVDPVAVVPFTETLEYGLVVTPLRPGVVSYGVHRRP